MSLQWEQGCRGVPWPCVTGTESQAEPWRREQEGRKSSLGTPGPCPAAGNSCSSEISSNFQCYTWDHIQPLLLCQEMPRRKWELRNGKWFFKLTTDYIVPSPHQTEGAERGFSEISFLLHPAFHPHPRQEKALQASTPTKTQQIPSDCTMELLLSKPSLKSDLAVNINANKWLNWALQIHFPWLLDLLFKWQASRFCQMYFMYICLFPIIFSISLITCILINHMYRFSIFFSSQRRRYSCSLGLLKF